MPKNIYVHVAVVLCVITPLGLPAQNATGILTAPRLIDWSTAGMSGAIPQRTTACANLNPGVTAAQVNAAISACPGGQTVVLAAGSYSFDTAIIFNNKSSVTVRGAGPDKTFVSFTGGDPCGGLGGDVCFINGDPDFSGNPHNVADWSAGYAQGTTQVTLSNTSNLQLGSQLILDQLDDALTDTGSIWICQTVNVCSQEGGSGNGRPGRGETQIVRVTGISGNTVTISPGVYMPNFRSSQQPQAWWSNALPITMSGIEEMSLDHSSSPNGISGGIFLYNAYNCWVKNVRSLNSNEAHVFLYQSTHDVVRDSYFYGTRNAASQSYGVLQFLAADNLTENNIFQHISSPMINSGTDGSVYAYNYAIDDFYTAGGTAPNWQQASAYLHAVGNDFILWEGNSGIGQTGDDIHGTSLFITSFRNNWNGRDGTKIQQTNAVQLQSFNRYYNFVGNVMGTAGYHTVYEVQPVSTTDLGDSNKGDLAIFNTGFGGNEGTRPAAGLPNDLLVRATLLRWGNYDTVTNAVRWQASEVPSGLSLYANPVPASQSLPGSFYISAKPAWWGSTQWPSIGPDISGGSGPGGHAQPIPAESCYSKTPKDSAGILIFTARNCYATYTAAPPSPPAQINATSH